jgi:predicted nucleic acid-binding protein
VTTKGVLIDAGPLVAILSKRDQYHGACVAAAKSLRGPFYTSWPAITEAAYLLKTRAEKVETLLARIRTGRLRLLPLVASDVDGIGRILMQYADQDFDLADVSLMYLAERESTETIFTVNRRHFSIFRKADGTALNLVPASA